MGKTSRVVIGMDPHKRSATIEAMAEDEEVLGRGRFETDPAGCEAMLAAAQQWPDRVWAIEGCEGIGKHLVLRLLDRGEPVVDVPAKLSARDAGLPDRAGPQDRRHRRPLHRPGRSPDERPA
jgi:transposase